MAKAKCTDSVCTCKVLVTQRVKNAKENLNFLGTLGTTPPNQNLDKLKGKEKFEKHIQILF